MVFQTFGVQIGSRNSVSLRRFGDDSEG